MPPAIPQGSGLICKKDEPNTPLAKKAFCSNLSDDRHRKIPGWSVGRDRTVNLTLNALCHARKERRLEKYMIFHTDRGIEYTAYRFRDELKKHGIRHSVNRPGFCTANAHMVSFFHTSKAESIRGRKFIDEKELRFSFNSHINQFYDHLTMHSRIGYIPPAVFERIAA